MFFQLHCRSLKFKKKYLKHKKLIKKVVNRTTTLLALIFKKKHSQNKSLQNIRDLLKNLLLLVEVFRNFSVLFSVEVIKVK